MNVTPARPSPSSSGRRRSRRTPEAGDRLEHEGRHGEHIDAHLGRVAQLLGPAPGGVDVAAGEPGAEAELDDEGDDQE